VTERAVAPMVARALTPFFRSFEVSAVARWIDRPYTVLGTDGFGRSDTREALRAHFEVSAEQIAYAALHGLHQAGEAGRDELVRAIAELGIDPDRIDPLRA